MALVMQALVESAEWKVKSLMKYRLVLFGLITSEIGSVPYISLKVCHKLRRVSDSAGLLAWFTFLFCVIGSCSPVISLSYHL